MQTFFWSDLHIGHARMAEQWRPAFGGSVASHNEAIRDRWNSVVTPADRVIVVGDLCMGKLDESLPFLDTLNGRIWLIPGNHDRFHPSYAKPAQLQRWLDRYGEHVQVVGTTIVPADTFGVPEAIVCHFPWHGTPDHAPERDLIDTYGPKRDHYSPCTVLIHGHTHAQERTGDHTVHVGVDAWPDGPVPAETVAAIAEEVRACH